MSYLGVLLVLAAGALGVVAIAAREVDRLRARMVETLQDGVDRHITLMGFVRDGCVLIDQRQQQLLVLERERQGIERHVIPFNRLLSSELLCDGEVVARYRHSDERLAACADQALAAAGANPACERLRRGHGVRLVSGARGRAVICLPLPDARSARDWHARMGVVIRRNSAMTTRIRMPETRPYREHRQQPAAATQAATPPVRPPAPSPAPAPEPAPPRKDDDGELAALREALLARLPAWLEHGRRSHVIVPEPQLCEMTGLDLPLDRFHTLMNRLRRTRGLPGHALSFTRKPDKWRISRRQR